MAELEKMGEFVRSASSTIEAPVVRRLKEQFAGDSAKPGRQGQRAAAPAARRDQGGDGQRGDRGPGQVSGDDVNGGAPSAPVGQVAPAPAPIAGDRGSVADTSSGAPDAAGTRPAPRPVPPRPVPSVPDVGAPVPGLPTPGVQRRARLVPGSRARDQPDRPAAGRARGRRRRGLARSVLAVRRGCPRRPAAARPALAARAPLAPRRVPALRGRLLPGSAARARVPGLVTTRSARRRLAWARPRRRAPGSATVTVTVTA